MWNCFSWTDSCQSWSCWLRREAYPKTFRSFWHGNLTPSRQFDARVAVDEDMYVIWKGHAVWMCRAQRLPTFKNYTNKFKGVLGYICYASNSVMTSAILEFPTEQVLLGENRLFESPTDEEICIPNEQWSSDHITLVEDAQLLQHQSLTHAATM